MASFTKFIYRAKPRGSASERLNKMVMKLGLGLGVEDVSSVWNEEVLNKIYFQSHPRGQF